MHILTPTITIFLTYLYCHLSYAIEKPPLQHASKYHQVVNISDYYISEKLDGVRGYWDGNKLYTRQGHEINVPTWFTQYWPPIAMDGELWSERNQFEFISGCVRKQSDNNSCWQKLRFMIFDLPHHQGKFNQRVAAMNKLINQTTDQSINIIPQFKVSSLAELDKRLDQVIAQGGEGLMVHHQEALYRNGRSKSIMKLKRYQDSEATVIAHIEGKGKYKNKLGALLVENTNGKRFKIGTGFTDKNRSNPPPIGSIITYKYLGLTRNNIPKFASFLRVRSPVNSKKNN